MLNLDFIRKGRGTLIDCGVYRKTDGLEVDYYILLFLRWLAWLI